MRRPDPAIAGRPRTSVYIAELTLICLALLLAAGPAGTASATGFRENRADANGDYLWSYPENWTAGVPDINKQAEFGDDNSGPVYCVLDVPVAVSRGVEIAEHFVRRTNGSGLHILEGTSLTSYSRFQVGKDDLGFLTVDGNLTILPPPSGPAYPHFQLGHYGHSNARGTATISSTGSVYVDGSIYLLGIRMPGAPWGDGTGAPVDRDYGSSLTVAGSLTFRRGAQIFSALHNLPGILRIEGNATVTQNSHYANFLNVEGGGMVEIDGAGATINVRMLNLTGGTDYYGADNPATLKLTGDGISTIHNVGATTLGAMSLLDVSELSVAPGTYTVIDGVSISDGGLAFAPGTDTGNWSFAVDSPNGNLLLTYDLGGVIMGDVDGSGYVDDYDLSLLLAYWDYGAEWTQGDLNADQAVDDDDLSLLLSHWNEGTLPPPDSPVPEPTTLALLAMGGAALIGMRRRASA